MTKVAPGRQDEIFITRSASPAVARAIQRRARNGELTRVAEGIYLQEKVPAAQAAIVRRLWARIVAALVPKAVVSHRSAFAGGPSPDGIVFVTHPSKFNRSIALPGMRITLLKGPGALAGDMPIAGDALYLASRPRQFLENLTPVRGARGKSAGAHAVEQRLAGLLNAAGDAELNRIRDQAREIAGPLALASSFDKLDALIGALLATRAPNPLKTKTGRRAAQGTPVDTGRLARFEILASRLRTTALPRRDAVATNEPARSNFAFLESYFSNFVEGTEFAIEEAKDITLGGRIVANRPADSHDVLGVFELALRSPGRDTVPPIGPDFPLELARRHAQMLFARPQAGPGQFKVEPNRAGGTWFVEPTLVRGTLIEGALQARGVPEGLARAIFYAFLVSEVHPFADGNGRLSRLIMNAELSRVGEARIIIPTLFHEEYVDCQRLLSRQDDPAGFVKVLPLMQAWATAFDYSSEELLIEAVKRTNALERSRNDFKLTMADGGPLREKVDRP